MARTPVELGTLFLVTFIADNEPRRKPEVWPMVESTVIPLGIHIGCYRKGYVLSAHPPQGRASSGLPICFPGQGPRKILDLLKGNSGRRVFIT